MQIYKSSCLKEIMDLIVIFTSLCICLSMLLTPCVATHNNIHEKANNVDDENKFSLPMILPRKLRVLLVEKASLTVVDGHGAGNDHHQDSTSYNKQKDDISSGKAAKKEENVIHGKIRSGTRQEWVEEGTDTSQFYTMDYSHVRRRRPIHNKSLPVGP